MLCQTYGLWTKLIVRAYGSPVQGTKQARGRVSRILNFCVLTLKTVSLSFLPALSVLIVKVKFLYSYYPEYLQ